MNNRGISVAKVPESSSRIEFANSLRGLASLSVLISHYLGVFWLKREIAADLANAPLLPADRFAVPSYVRWLHPFEAFDWGPFGVGVFFLISGFVIPFSIERYGWRAFGISRFLRLYPTYVTGLTVSIAAVCLSGAFFGRDFPYSVSETVIHYLMGVRDIAWSRNIDGIIWTLEIEVHFYMLCMAVAIGLRRGSRLLSAVPVAILAGSLLLYPHMAGWSSRNASAYHLAYIATLNGQFLIYMSIGVAFNLHYRQKLRSDVLPFVVAALLGLFAATWYYSVHRVFFGQIWSYGLALLVFSGAYAFADRCPRYRVVGFFADISYPLYVVHGVAGYVALRVLLDLGMKAWLSILLVAVGAFGLAWLVHIWIEAPTQRLGRRLANRLTPMPTPAGAPIFLSAKQQRAAEDRPA
jgi:peptidoglycan/LPS O-acetylase OafA/YrhL